MSNTANTPSASSSSGGVGGSGEVAAAGAVADGNVPVVTRLWCTIVMVPLASFMCLAQTSFAASGSPVGSAGFYWFLFSSLISLLSGFSLVARSQYPEPAFWVACVLVVVFPFDPLIVYMALTALLARRRSRRITLRSIVVAAAVSLYSHMRDALRPAEQSLWHAFFADPSTGQGGDTPLTMLTSEPVILITAAVTAIAMVGLSVLIGLHIRSRAELKPVRRQTLTPGAAQATVTATAI